MPLDAGLFNALGAKPKSMTDFQNEYAQQDQNALALKSGQLSYQNALLGQQQDAAYRDAAKNFGNDPTQNALTLYRAGLPTQAAAVLKAGLDAKKTSAEAAKFGAETDQKNYDLRLQKRNQAIADIAALSTPAEALASLDHHLSIGDIDQQKYEAVKATIPQDPAQFPSWRRNMIVNIMKPEDQLKTLTPDVKMESLGGSIVPVNTNANAAPVGPLAGAAPLKLTPSPDATLRASMERERLSFDKQQPRGVVVQTDQGPVLADPRTGSTTPLRDQSGTALGPKQKDIPQAVIQGYTKNQSALQKIDDAIASITANPSSIGAFNMLGDTIRQRTDPGGVQTRAVVADIGSLKIHDRTGAAMSAAESLRLKPFIPNTTDTPEAAVAKLQQLKREYLDQNQGIEGYYNADMGFKPIAALKREPNSPGAARPAQPATNLPPTNPQGWVLHTDAKGNKAYVSPDGKQFKEVR